jgi:HlyD family secretion protein
MWSRRNLLLLGAAILLGAGVGAVYWQRRLAADQVAQAAIRQEVVGRGTIASTVSATGFLSPHAQVSLYFAAPALAPVAEINVVLGQAVREGEVLARLDSRELELAVAQAEHNLRAARLALAQLEAPPRAEDVALAEAALRLARAQVFAASQGNRPEAIEMARLNLLIAQNTLNQTYKAMDILVAQGDLGWQAKNTFLQPQADQQVMEAKIADERYHAAQAPPDPAEAVSASAAVEQAQVALDRLKNGPRPEDLEIARLQIDQAEAALEVARHDLAHAQITAPFDGVVAAVHIRPGELVLSALPAIVLADVSSLYLEVAVDEVDVARVIPGQPASVTLDALPEVRLSGRVEDIALVASNNAGVVTYAVRLLLDPAPARVRAGMTATAEITVAEARDVVRVPNWAVRRDPEGGLTYAGIMRNGRIEDVAVTLGLSDEAYSEVISGLLEGDVVAVDTTRNQFRLVDLGQ